MALRDFTDKQGRAWRVWDVTPETMHPSTRTEDYMRDYLEGWLTFESVDGEAKCRLTPIPKGWETATVTQLTQWLHEAQPVRGDRTSGPHGLTAAETLAAARATGAQGSQRTAADSVAARTFRFPGGRYWSVAEWASVEQGAGGAPMQRRVLRFTSGARALDLTSWPGDWQGLSDADLAELLARSFPRPEGQRNPTTYRRRASDQQL